MKKKRSIGKNLIVKSNQLIESSYHLSATEKKLVLSVVSMVNPGDEQFCRYSLKINDFMKMADIKDKTSYRRIREASKNLMEKVFEIQQPNSLLQLSWFSSVEYFHGEGEVEIEISPKLKPFLLKLKEQFTQYQLKNIIRLKSFYSIRLYELLKQYEPLKERTFEVEKLKDILGIAPEKYRLYGHFKAKVLLVAQKEINSKTDISFTFNEVKEQRRIAKLKFFIKPKMKEIIQETNKNLHLFSDKTTLPKEVLEVLPEKYQIKSIYYLIEPYFDDLDFLVSNIEYATKNCDKNYPAYLRLALKNDYAKVNREVKEKKEKIVQEKKDHIQEKKNKEKLLKQKAWDYFNSLPEGEQFKFRTDAEEKMSAILKIIKISERRNDIINVQIEKDLIVELERGREE